jgi:hypothetical protein
MKKRQRTPSIQAILNRWKQFSEGEKLLEVQAYQAEWDQIKNKCKRGERRQFRKKLETASYPRFVD